MRWALGAFIVVTAAVAFSLRPAVAESWTMWLGLLVPYSALSAIALYRMAADGALRDKLRLKAGDITLGVVVAAVLIGAAWAVREGLTPQGSERAGWLFRVLIQVGDIQGLPAVVMIFLLALAEEIVWRGLVLTELGDALGTRRAWPAAAALYAAAHLPTVWFLSDPAAGPNPLIFLAALAGGFCWSYMASRMGRLPPVMISHLAFSYFAPALMLPGLWST